MFYQYDDSDSLPPEPETEEATPKKGVACFFDLLTRHCVGLVKGNLLFLLGCVPVITIPVSLFALNRTVRQMVLDQPVQCFQTYRETFWRSWKQSYAAFLLTALPLGCGGCGMWFYLSRASSNPLFFLPFLVCSTIFLMTLLSSGCLYGLLDSGKGLKEALRLALLLGITRPDHTGGAVLLWPLPVGRGVLPFERTVSAAVGVFPALYARTFLPADDVEPIQYRK